MTERRQAYEIMRVMKSVKEAIHQSMHDEFKDLNLTGPQYMLIGIIAKLGPIKISDLSEKMGLSNSTVSGIVDRLEKLSYVERIRSEKDRRVVRVDLTASFKKIAEKRFTFNHVDHYWEKIMMHGSPEEVKMVLDGLKTLEALMKRAKKEVED